MLYETDLNEIKAAIRKVMREEIGEIVREEILKLAPEFAQAIMNTPLMGESKSVAVTVPNQIPTHL